ncbi:MAG: hypothetical protein Phyf2KO_19400 [Phycisphaerales bacterium]
MIRQALTGGDDPSGEDGKSLPRLDSCILLAGGLVPSPLAKLTGQLTLELWLSATETVFGRWCDVLDHLALSAGIDHPSIRVVHSGPPYEPTHVLADDRFEVRTIAEPDEFRGPAGVLRDVTQNDSPDSIILVAEAARYIAGTINQLFADWSEHEPDVLVARSPDGTPAGITLMRASALGLVPDTGFMDVKEQWLPRCIEEGLDIRTSTTRNFMPFPLRTLEQFLVASSVASGKPCPITERQPVLGRLRPITKTEDKSRIAEDAKVARDAVVADAVIMPGAKVGSGAIVVRSLVCPGAVVPAGDVVVDTVVAAARKGVPSG